MRVMRPSRHRRDRNLTLGQSLVEFAIVLPIILFLTLIALDFGRVYLGWINIQSMSRIAANIAANNPTAWTGSGDAAVKAKYQNQIRNDAAATNCNLPKVGGVTTAPAPTFTDTGGNGANDDLGDSAEVRLSCSFSLITPGISNILGGSVAVSASSVFPVSTGMIDPANAGTPGVAPTAAFTGNAVFAPSTISCVAPCTVVFRDTSGGNPTSWVWVFSDGTPNSSAQDPLDHVFVLAGTYVVTLTASNAYGSSTESMGITVVETSTVDFTGTPTSGNSPLAVAFTSTAAPGGTAFAWTFGDGNTGSGATVNHTYSTPGFYTVSLTVTYPVAGNLTQTKTNYISVAVGLCTVPQLFDTRRNNAQATWTGAGFTGTVTDGPGAPSGNYLIKRQSFTANSKIPCSSSVVVNNP